MTKSNKSEPPRPLEELRERLRDVRVQLLLLGGLVGAVVLAIFLTDLATGGDAEPPDSLGSENAVTAGTRVAVIPTLIPSATPGPEGAATATASNEAEALARDAERLRELPLLQAALAEYRDRSDEYPSTGGQVQTLCRYQDLDNGCDLKEVLDDDEEGILEDPLSVDKFYYYASNGETYSIWMVREGPGAPGDPICQEIPPEFKDVGSLFCVTAGGTP